MRKIQGKKSYPAFTCSSDMKELTCLLPLNLALLSRSLGERKLIETCMLQRHQQQVQVSLVFCNL